MKRLLPAAVIIVLVMESCLKSTNTSTCTSPISKVVVPSSEIVALQDTLIVHGIQATEDTSGFFYTINGQGTGQAFPNLCSTITVTYKGSLFNGNVFDSTATGNVANFQLNNVILGWQKGIPLISQGGDITLYIPPSLGYDTTTIKNPTTGAVIIPANSNLIFNVQVLDIQ